MTDFVSGSVMLSFMVLSVMLCVMMDSFMPFGLLLLFFSVIYFCVYKKATHDADDDIVNCR